MRPLGEAHMKVEYIGSQYTLPFLIVRERAGAPRLEESARFE